MTGMTIGTLAAAAGVKVSTVRYYERARLMPPPERTAAGQRTYTKDHQRRLLFICRARELDFSIEDTKTLLTLADSTCTPCRELEHMAAAHLKKLRQKITALKKVEAMVAGAIGECSGKTSLTCPVLELLGCMRFEGARPSMQQRLQPRD
jgi:MerR family mercuric resistance operon transcriptional regulator